MSDIVDHFIARGSENVPRSFWVHVFHSAPHINLTLRAVNATFNPRSHVYQEVSHCLLFPPNIILVNILLELDSVPATFLDVSRAFDRIVAEIDAEK